MAPRRIFTLLCLAGLVGWSIACLGSFVSESFGEFVDSAIYLLTARSLAEGEGYRYLGEPFFVRPPGLSWLLAPLAEAPWDHLALNRFVQVTAVLSFAGVALALGRLHGAALGLLGALLFATNRLTVQLFNKVFAEFGFLALFFGGVALLLPDREGRPAGRARLLCGALLVAASLWLRSTGLLILPALALTALWPRRGAARASLASVLLPAALILGLHLPWMAWAARAAEQAPRPSTQLLMFDYGTAMFRVDPSDPDSALVDLDGWAARVADNVAQIVPALGEAFLGTGSGPLPPLLALVLAGALAYAWWDRRSLLDAYALACAALLLCYFTFADRLLLPLLPLLISALLHVIERVCRARMAGPRGAERALAACGALGLLLLFVSATHLREDLAPVEHKAFNRVADGAAARWLAEHTPPEALVLHERGAIMSVLSGRRTYTWRNLPGAWPAGSPEVDWIVLGPQPSPIENDVAAAALERRRVVAEFGGQRWVVRLYRMRDPPR